jgi:hypothetical protein
VNRFFQDVRELLRVICLVYAAGRVGVVGYHQVNQRLPESAYKYNGFVRGEKAFVL